MKSAKKDLLQDLTQDLLQIIWIFFIQKIGSMKIYRRFKFSRNVWHLPRFWKRWFLENH